MSRRYSKWILLAVAGLVVLVLTLRLGAWPLAQPSPAASSLLTPPASPEPQKSTTSTQPKITWSEKQVEVILSPAESAPKSLTFASSLDFTDAVIEAAPEIAGFLTIQPSTFANVPANQPQQVMVNFAIPSTAALGTFEGTIRVRTGSQTLPATLKVVVNVWARVTNSQAGAEFKVPSLGDETTVEMSQTANGDLVLDFQLRDRNAGEFFSVFVLGVHNNPSHLSLRDWFEQTVDRNHILLDTETFREQTLANGLPALLLERPVPVEYGDQNGPVQEGFLMSPSSDRVVSIIQSQENKLFTLGYSQEQVIELLKVILGTVRFQ